MLRESGGEDDPCRRPLLPHHVSRLEQSNIRQSHFSYSCSPWHRHVWSCQGAAPLSARCVWCAFIHFIHSSMPSCICSGVNVVIYLFELRRGGHIQCQESFHLI